MRLRNFALLICLTLTSGLAAATEFTTVQEGMSKQEFAQAGLDKLTAEQLAALNGWIAGQMGKELVKQEKTLLSSPSTAAAVFKNPVMMGFRGYEGARAAIDSRLTGDFRGWYGKTQFTLDNGQVWEQNESGSFDSLKLKNPIVRIKPAIAGSWLMDIKGCGCSVRVFRIR